MGRKELRLLVLEMYPNARCVKASPFETGCGFAILGPDGAFAYGPTKKAAWRAAAEKLTK